VGRKLNRRASKYFSEAGLVEPLFGDGDHGVVEAIVCRQRGYSVCTQKKQGCTNPRAFVSIQKSLCLRQVKSVGGCNVK
jgi:hypothetical protein